MRLDECGGISLPLVAPTAFWSSRPPLLPLRRDQQLGWEIIEATTMPPGSMVGSRRWRACCDHHFVEYYQQIRRIVMGYSMRFYDTDLRPLRISELRAGLREIDPAFEIEDESERSDSGYLLYNGELYADITIDSPDSDYFASEMDSLKADLGRSVGSGKAHVEAVLRDARRQVFVRVRYGGRDTETTLSRLDMLWDWLFANRSGLLYAEGEGFYQDETLVLAIK